MTVMPDSRASDEVMVCGGHPEVRLAMSAALGAQGLTVTSCPTSEVPTNWVDQIATLVVVLSRADDDIATIRWAVGRSVRVIAVHGPTDLRGREAARQAGAHILIPRSGRTAPLVDAVLGTSAGPVAAETASGLPDQPRPEQIPAVRSPR